MVELLVCQRWPAHWMQNIADHQIDWRAPRVLRSAGADIVELYRRATDEGPSVPYRRLYSHHIGEIVAAGTAGLPLVAWKVLEGILLDTAYCWWVHCFPARLAQYMLVAQDSHNLHKWADALNASWMSSSSPPEILLALAV